MIITVTGHRPPKLGGYSDAAREVLERFAERVVGYCKGQHDDLLFRTGMAQGWDQAIATACLTHDVRYHAFIPFEDQFIKWPPTAVVRWNDLCHSANASTIVVSDCELGKIGFRVALQRRNEAMVDGCDAVLALHDGSSGGTLNCIRYANRQRGVRTVNYWPAWLRHLDSGA